MDTRINKLLKFAQFVGAPENVIEDTRLGHAPTEIVNGEWVSRNFFFEDFDFDQGKVLLQKIVETPGTSINALSSLSGVHGTLLKKLAATDAPGAHEWVKNCLVVSAWLFRQYIYEHVCYIRGENEISPEDGFRAMSIVLDKNHIKIKGLNKLKGARTFTLSTWYKNLSQGRSYLKGRDVEFPRRTYVKEFADLLEDYLNEITPQT